MALTAVAEGGARHDAHLVVLDHVVRELLGGIDRHLDAGRYSVSVHLVAVRALRGGAAKAARELGGEASPKPAAGESFEAAAAAVSKAIGRDLTATDRVILRRMHAANKTAEEMATALQ